MLVGTLIWALGLGTVLSFSLLADLTFLKGTIYANVDYLSSNVMLPLGGLFITIFAAWVMCRNSTAEELGGAGQAAAGEGRRGQTESQQQHAGGGHRGDGPAPGAA